MKKINILFFLAITIITTSCKKNEVKQTRLTGGVFGTSYSLIYDSNINYQKQIDHLFDQLNKSMSNYQTNSIISKVNRNEIDSVDTYFKNVYKASQKIYTETKGVFDPTIGTLVNAYGFGSGKKIKHIDSLKRDSLLQFVGLNKTQLINNKITKPKGTFIDFNAIAKGYAVDVIANFLEQQQCNNYVVEIGGEIRVKGRNNKKKSSWKIGIDDPKFDGTESYSKIISLTNCAMATSGTYRKFKVDENGNRYAHIINALTGSPSKTNVLSVSVIAKNCMVADGYATAFQAMGIKKVTEFLKTHPELQVYFIFEDNNKTLKTLNLNGFPE
ncbi:FAD:protein FMN transferase [Tenacibaculum sp. UWU-22]|uniref:FAD:protein FMN transferase n=1 Tax=Tenacibaculum sp. UWU-22 TaxID=3234187 RepID=UPI0034DB59B1